MTLTERIRLAQELHDGIAQDLVAIGYGLDLVLAIEGNPIQTRFDVRKIRFDVNELLEKIRHEIHDLHTLKNEDLGAQITFAAKAICDGYNLEFDLPEYPVALAEEDAYQVLRIFSETLRNIVRHSDATQVSISLIQSADVFTLVVRDNGEGKAEPRADSFGLVGAKSRAENLGGELSWSMDGTGFEVRLSFPSRLARP